MEQTTDFSTLAAKINEIKEQISKVIVGQEKVIDQLLTAIISNGHVLIEGVPGVAKTLLARLVCKIIDAEFSRIQFTPDLMPSDVLGTTVFNVKNTEFEFHKGPVFANVILVDEINRAPAKTQAALFEVMEERQATIDGNTYNMPLPYNIIATQNPIEQEGTYRLPEAQLDRFLMKILIGYPEPKEEKEILMRHNQNKNFVSLEDIKPVVSREEIIKMQDAATKVTIEESLVEYIIRIVYLTRNSKIVHLGASPRASVAILNTAKAHALINGRYFVAPDDIKTMLPAVLRHRIQLTAEAEMEGMNAEKVVKAIIEKIEMPK